MKNEAKTTNKGSKTMSEKIMFDGIEVSYTVFPSVHRFTGEYALTKAIRWAEKVKQATPEQCVTIKNEMGAVIGKA